MDNHKGDPIIHVGLMAQDVERVDPGAVHEFGGIKFVDYDRATRPAANYASALARYGGLTWTA